jgi:hypothetical protein
MGAEDIVFGFFAGGFILALFVKFWDRALGLSHSKTRRGGE